LITINHTLIALQRTNRPTRGSNITTTVAAPFDEQSSAIKNVSNSDLVMDQWWWNDSGAQLPTSGFQQKQKIHQNSGW
jgi:hypothetical protein